MGRLHCPPYSLGSHKNRGQSTHFITFRFNFRTPLVSDLRNSAKALVILLRWPIPSFSAIHSCPITVRLLINHVNACFRMSFFGRFCTSANSKASIPRASKRSASASSLPRNSSPLKLSRFFPSVVFSKISWSASRKLTSPRN